MANPLRGQISLNLGQKEYKARLTVDAIMQIEDALDMGIIKVAQNMAQGDVRLGSIVKILTPALRGGGNNLQEADVIKLIQQAGIVEATRVVAEMLALVLSSGENEESGDEKKPESESEN